jgi:CelD/BcsL family acetyltransferase involved in cellulose biosynthesis
VTLETIQLPLSDPTWGAFARSCSSALPFHHPSWGLLLANCYGYRPLALAVVDNHGEIVGGMPVLDVQRPFSSRRYVSLPFTDYCPILAKPTDTETSVAQSLIGAAATLPLDALEVRAALPTSEGVYSSVQAVRHTLELSADSESVARGISKHHRRNIRRAEQSDLRLRFGTGVRDMAVFYRLHLLTRQRQGVPVQPWHFFESLALMLEREHLGYIALVYRDEAPVAAAVFMTWQRVLIYKYGASDPEFWELRPNNFLFWQAIRWGCEHGFGLFDWGRTDLDNSGLREFKSGWGAREEQLVYSVIADRPPAAGSGRAERAMATVIRRSPTWVCRAMGEVLYRYAA